MPSFSRCQLRFNSLHFQLRSEKNITHGRNNNQMVEHWLPPSASRRCIICNMLLYPLLEQSQFLLPSNNLINQAISEMFAKTMQLQSPLGTKMNRDFISVLIDYLAPRSLAKTSTTKEMASLFHHSPEIHDKHYSASIFRRDVNGKMIPSPLVTATYIWQALGETVHPTSERPVVSNRILTKAHYDAAAKHQCTMCNMLPLPMLHHMKSINMHLLSWDVALEKVECISFYCLALIYINAEYHVVLLFRRITLC